MDLFKFQDNAILAEWLISETEQGEHTDRIKMNWCDTQGPVLI